GGGVVSAGTAFSFGQDGPAARNTRVRDIGTVKSILTFIPQYPHAEVVAGAVVRHTALDHLQANDDAAVALGESKHAAVRLFDIEGNPPRSFGTLGELTV